MATLDELAVLRDAARAKSESATQEAIDAAGAGWKQWAADTPRKIVIGQAVVTDSLSDPVLAELKQKLGASIDSMADALAATLEATLRDIQDIDKVKSWFFQEWWSPFGKALKAQCEEFLTPMWAIGFDARKWDAPASLYVGYADDTQAAAEATSRAFRAYVDSDNAYNAQVETERRERSESRFDAL